MVLIRWRVYQCALYLFHVRTGEVLHRDVHAAEIREPEKIIGYVESLADKMTSDRTKLCDWGQSSVEVEDENGSFFAVLSFASILRNARFSSGVNWASGIAPVTRYKRRIAFTTIALALLAISTCW